MESIFFLEEGDRAVFLLKIMESLGCTYICLWQYFQPSNNLMSLDGIYSGENDVAQRLFQEYRHSWLTVDNSRIPGLAFMNGVPFMELQFSHLQSRASNPVQLQFYQEAGIKTAIYMGCRIGEIELGMTCSPQVNMEISMRNLFPEYFPSTPATSSSSFSIDSPEYSSLLFNIPRAETEEAALTKAYLAVMTSHASSSSSRDELPAQKGSAFKSFRSGLGLNHQIRRQNMFKRSIIFFRNLSRIRSREQQIQGSRHVPTNTQAVHHMISERRRREKLNDSFQLLRSLLPPGTKKDKASVLASTTRYLSSLKAQVEELSKRNQILEAESVQPAGSKLTQPSETDEELAGSSNRRLAVEITNVGESTSESTTVDLHVSVPRGECSILDLLTRLLQFLKAYSNVTLESVAANTILITLRLRIQGSEWNESAFEEAVKRVVGDLA